MASHEAEEVTFVLPSQQASKFEKLFETLETDRETLGIKSFGVSVTTMEEVFLRSAAFCIQYNVSSYSSQVFLS